MADTHNLLSLVQLISNLFERSFALLYASGWATPSRPLLKMLTALQLLHVALELPLEALQHRLEVLVIVLEQRTVNTGIVTVQKRRVSGDA